jgi:Domain of unknown function (DUF4845)
MRKYQRGITFLGWIILLVPVAIVFYAGVRLTPLYLNYLKIVHTLDAVVTEIPNDGAAADGIRNVIDKHFQIDSLDYPSAKDLKIVRENSVWTIEANYEDQAPLFANMALLVTFDKKVKLKGGGGE